MGELPGKRQDRYDVSGNIEAQYVDAAQTVLRNRRGITSLVELQLAEEQALAEAYERLLGEVQFNTPMTCALLRRIHACIFADLYDWAGRWRTVWISKPGTTWPAPDFLDRNMDLFEQFVLRKYPAAKLQNDDSFSLAAAEIQGEFLVVHPFREGNARTIKLMTNLLAIQAGRPLLVYDASQTGQEVYTAAAQAAFGRDYRPLAEIIGQTLQQARQAT